MKNSKELFVKAFLEAEEISNAQIAKATDAVTFSNAFEKKMNKLLKKEKTMHFSTRRTVQNSLAAAVIAILILFTGLMSVAATREPILEFVKKVFPQFNEITLEEVSPPPMQTIATEYTLINLPEGYVLDTYSREEFRVQSVWKNECGEEIAFTQSVIDTTFTIDNEYLYREIDINGFKAFLAENEHDSTLRWTDGCYSFTIKASAGMKNDIIRLQENIFVKN